jgi:ribonucleotide reductase alpha subunit
MCRVVGDQSVLAPDLFYALWVPDLLMKRVIAGAQWTLFNPSTAPG